jgi:hypothetical protein
MLPAIGVLGVQPCTPLLPSRTGCAWHPVGRRTDPQVPPPVQRAHRHAEERRHVVHGPQAVGESGEGSSAWLAPLALGVGGVVLVLFVLRQRALVRSNGPLLDCGRSATPCSAAGS